MSSSSLSNTVKIQANRLRCQECNADSDHMVFLSGDDIRFRHVIGVPKSGKPIYKKPGKVRATMGMNKNQALTNSNVILRICTRCGSGRKVFVPNN